MKKVFAPRTNQHERGWGGRNRTTHVPLLSSGEMHQGFFRVPETFAVVGEHTNLAHQVRQFTIQKVRDWVEFKSRSGYRLIGKPVVTDPLLSPTTSDGVSVDSGDEMRVWVRAKFVREMPMKMPLDLFLHKRDEAKRYGVDLEQSLLETPIPRPRETLIADSVADPMVEAESRRQQLGVRRELQVTDGEVTGAEVIYETPGSSDGDAGLGRDQGVN